MKNKGISPIVATVLLIAFTLAVAGLLGGWLTSLTKTQTDTIEQGTTKAVNCSSAVIDIVNVICANSSQQLKVAINNVGQNELWDFSVFAAVNNTFYSNSTGGPNSTNTLKLGEQVILVYGCDKNTYCANNALVNKVRVTPGNCPQAYAEKTVNVRCTI